MQGFPAPGEGVFRHIGYLAINIMCVGKEHYAYQIKGWLSVMDNLENVVGNRVAW